MSLKKMPKEQRDKLILVAVGTVLAVCALYYFVVQHQNASLTLLAKKKAEVEAQQHQVSDAVRHASEVVVGLTNAQTALAEAEADIASGDLYASILNTIRSFKAPYQVSIPQPSSLSPVSDVNLLPIFPYQQATITLAGTAHFHDFGRFVADLENRFPHLRVVNLSLDSNLNPTAIDGEMVSFKLDLITLVKANPS